MAGAKMRRLKIYDLPGTAFGLFICATAAYGAAQICLAFDLGYGFAIVIGCATFASAVQYVDRDSSVS
jgi:hypothetical protein